MQPTNQPRVFISYSWKPESNRAWVEKLARELLANGIDVILDFWEVKPGMDLNAFMERMVTDQTVNRVLIVCNHDYVERSDHRIGGVGKEGLIVSQEVYESAFQSKFIPIVRERDHNESPVCPFF